MGPYVGATGFEPAASRSQSGRSTKLSYAPGGLARMCVLIGPKKSSRSARTPLPVRLRGRDQENRRDQDESRAIRPDPVDSPESSGLGRVASSAAGADRGEIAG